MEHNFTYFSMMDAIIVIYWLLPIRLVKVLLFNEIILRLALFYAFKWHTKVNFIILYLNFETAHLLLSHRIMSFVCKMSLSN